MREEAADIVIVGGGFAGLAAGVATAQAGLRPLVLEQSSDNRYICNSRLTGGVFHCALRPADTSARELERIMLANFGPGANTALIRAIANDTLPSVRWLQSVGVRFIRASSDPWHRFVLAPPSLGKTGEAWRNRGGDTLLRTLEERLALHGGELRRGQAARSILRDGGAINGVAGDDFTIRAPAVVIADGGFQQNSELVALGISPQPDKLVQRNGGTGWGDGLTMARDIGAAIVPDLSGFYGHVLPKDAACREDMRFYPWLDGMARSGIAVTRDGRRFCDEGLGGIYIANRIAALSDPSSALVIWDEEIWQGPAKARFLSPNPTLERMGATIFTANSVITLAERAGIDVEGLASEIASYNRAVATRTTRRLAPNRSADGVAPMPILRPPFYAAPAVAGMTYTMSGIAVDECSRVLSVGGDPISGLFAIGGSSGGAEGGPRSAYVGGLVKAATTAWRAAQTIVSDRGAALRSRAWSVSTANKMAKLSGASLGEGGKNAAR